MILLRRDSKTPLYQQIYDQIREDILSGTLAEGTKLLGSRSFAKMYAVGRNTVDTAYHQLAEEGYIEAKKGAGFTVLNVRKFFNASMTNRELAQKKIVKNESEAIYDLTNSSHTSNLFPKKIWKKYSIEVLDYLEKAEKLSSLQDSQGELILRENLLSYLKRIRGVNCSEDQIVITSGLQQSLDYLCKLIASDASTIVMEEPGYAKARIVFENNSTLVRTVPVDNQGLVVEKLKQYPSADFIYTTPSHQFPTGVTLTISRRFDLLNYAKKNNLFVIEDDYDSELRYYAKPIPALQSIDRYDCVIYLGTFSKALSPSLRMSYMILPKRLLKRYKKYFGSYNSTVPLINQQIVANLLSSGEYDRHIRRLNNIFKKRLELFMNEFAELKDSIKIEGNGSGQYFLLSFHQSVNQQELIDAALEQGVKVYSTMKFWQEKTACPENTLFLGFSKISVENISDCVNRLKTAWKKWL